MKCQICGEPAMGGARLCSPCRKAIKRARHDTVSVAQPLPARAGNSIERRPARRAGASPAESAAASVIPPPLPAKRSQTSIFFGVLSVVVCAVAYLAVQHLYAGAHDEPAATQRPAVTATAAMSAPVAVAEPATPVSNVTVPPSEASTPKVPAAPARTGSPAPAKAPSVPVVTAQAPTEALSPFGPVTSPAPVEPAPAPRPVVREAPPPDRGQVISAAFAQCPRDNLIATAVCEQGVRIKYCDGYWGVLAQCPAGRANDYGQ